MFNKRNFTDEEKKILKKGSIFGKIIFWPCFIFWLLLVIVILTDWHEYQAAFWVITIPFIPVIYFAFSKQYFWKEEKQRAYILKIQEKQSKKNVDGTRKNSSQNSVPYKATPYYIDQCVDSFSGKTVNEQQNIKESTKEFPIQVKWEKSNNASIEIPRLQGNYAKTVFLWAFRKPTPIKNVSDYPSYLLYECGIRDSAAYHKELINEGYLVEASSSEKLDSLTVPELKKMLEELGQAVSGKKAELVKNIIAASDQEFLDSHCPEVYYKLSEEGEKFLTDNEPYAEIHKHKNWGVDWIEYDSVAKPGEDFLSVMWRIFSGKLEKANFTEQRDLYFLLYRVLVEKGNKSDALEMLLKVFYLDLSGTDGLEYLKYYKQEGYTGKTAKELYNISITFAPGNINSLREYKDYYDFEMIDQLYTWKLPIQICNKELFREIIESGVNGLFDDAKMDKAKKKLEAEYDKLFH